MAKHVLRGAIVYLIAIPLVFSVTRSMGLSAAYATIRSSFIFTIVVELLAFIVSLSVRRRFDADEPNRLIWTLVTGFLCFRLLAELRLLTLYFEWMPAWLTNSPSLAHFYVDWLRYLYTVSDLLLIAAVATNIRNYRSAGLQFRLLGRDFLYMAAACAVMAGTYWLRQSMMVAATHGADTTSLMIYRLVAVTLAAVVVCQCLVVRRFVLQMGGGVLAGVWTFVSFAGFARALSFFVFGLLSLAHVDLAEFAEQYFLWIFAWCWLVALLRQDTINRAADAKT